MQPIISLVSGTYNRIDSLAKMLQSFRANIPAGIPYEIVLVDGGSTDGTIEWCKSQADIHLIEHGSLKGAIIAFTEGAFAATGKYVLLANDDVTFFPNSIIPALVHLENHPYCGGVAFADNRPIDDYYTNQVYKVLKMPGIRHGRLDYLIYAQVGLFRKWLGDAVHWWGGEHDEMLKPGLVYGGDNNLSAHIWKHGYSIDEVEGCKVEDGVLEDELRVINRERGRQNNDSAYYYDQWQTEIKGPTVPDRPDLKPQHKRAARFLYLPIYDPAWGAARDPVVGKHGLRDALSRATNKYGEPSIVYEIDYMAVPAADLKARLIEACKAFQPDVILTQIQAPAPITEDILIALRIITPATIINWNGDQAVGGLKSGEIMRLLRHIDLQTMVSQDVSAYYDATHVNWAYWQIGYEEPGDNLEAKLDNYFKRQGRANPYINYPDYPVVFLASLYSEARKRIAEVVQARGGMVFVPSDKYDTLYNFAAGKFIYQHAKIALANNDYPDSYGFVSNRMMQVLAAGGAILLQQHVKGLQELTGITAGVHYIEYTTIEDLRAKIGYWLDSAHEAERLKIVEAARVFMEQHHSFDVRAKELFDFIKRKLTPGKQPDDMVLLRHVGGDGKRGGGGWPSVVRNMNYEFQAGHTLLVFKEDAEQMLKHTETWKLEGES